MVAAVARTRTWGLGPDWSDWRWIGATAGPSTTAAEAPPSLRMTLFTLFDESETLPASARSAPLRMTLFSSLFVDCLLVGSEDFGVMVLWFLADWAPGWITPMTGMGRECWMSGRERAVAVLQAMTRRSAPWSARKRELERA